jgi:hypothetical protein
MFFSFGKQANRLVHDQRRRLQGRHAIAKITDVLSEKAGAHFLLPAWEVKMTPVTKRSVYCEKIIKLF